MLTLEEEVAVFAFCLRTNRVHHSIIKQRLYQRREHALMALRRENSGAVMFSKVFSISDGFGDELTQ